MGNALIILLASVIVCFITCLISLVSKIVGGSSTNITGGGRKNVPIYYKLSESELFIKKASKIKNVEKILTNAKTCLYFSDIHHQMKYESTKQVVKNELHIGQLKLFLTELEFLTDSLQHEKESAIAIYSGSAPSNKIAFLSTMFPNVKFILVDPREHYVMFPHNRDMYDPSYAKLFLYFKTSKDSKNIKTKIQALINGEKTFIEKESFIPGDLPSNICEIIENGDEKFYIIEDYYTTQISKQLKPLCDKNKVLFISDIRSKSEDEENPTDLDIIWNSALMYNWIEALEPVHYMVKFRTPYNVGPEAYKKVMEDYEKNPQYADAIKTCKLPLLDNIKTGKFSYITGDVIYMQAFAGPTSTESRIVGKFDKQTFKTKNYDCDEYNDKFFYYNRIHRAYGYHTIHEDFLEDQDARDMGIDRCGDCAIMCEIFKRYYKKFMGDIPTTEIPKKSIKNIKDLLWIIRRDLKFGDTIHGRYFKQYKSFDDLHNAQMTLLSRNDALIVLGIKNIKLNKPLEVSDANNYLSVYNKFKNEDPKTFENIMASLCIGFYFGFQSDQFKYYFKKMCEKRNINFDKTLGRLYDSMNNSSDIGDAKSEDEFIENAFSINLNKSEMIINDSKFNKFVNTCKENVKAQSIYSIVFSKKMQFEGLSIDKVISFASGKIFDTKPLKGKLVLVRMHNIKYKFRQLIINNLVKNGIKFIYIGGISARNLDTETEILENKQIKLDVIDYNDKNKKANFTIFINGIDKSLLNILD